MNHARCSILTKVRMHASMHASQEKVQEPLEFKREWVRWCAACLYTTMHLCKLNMSCDHLYWDWEPIFQLRSKITIPATYAIWPYLAQALTASTLEVVLLGSDLVWNILNHDHILLWPACPVTLEMRFTKIKIYRTAD